MKQVLLISDTHRDDDTFAEIVRCYPDAKLMIHAGDSCYQKDDEHLKNMLVVKGNHDFADFWEYIISPPFFICHGHTFHVYAGFNQMIAKAKQHDCSIIIHGHTHIAYDQVHEGIRIINPGSVLINRGSYGYGTYAIMDLESQEVRFYHHMTHEDVTHEVLEDGCKTLASFRKLLQEIK